MNSSEKTTQLMAKAICPFFSLGEKVLDGWEARPIGGDNYMVKRSDGSETIVSVGKETRAGMVVLDKNENLMVGEWTVVVGENIQKGWEAKPARGKGNFWIKQDDGKWNPAKVGDDFLGQGIVSIDKYNNLAIGNSSLKILKKKYELALLVLKGQEKGGFVSYFNYIEPNNSSNRKDGTKGVFYPSRDGKQPSKFCEYGPDGGLYSTAVFWPSKDQTFSCGNIRSLDIAIKEAALFQQIKDFEKEAKELETEPCNIYGYDDAKKELADINSNSWKENRFNVTMGHSLFRLKNNKKMKRLY